MRTAATLTAYAATLAVLLAGGYAAGTAVGPLAGAAASPPAGPVAGHPHGGVEVVSGGPGGLASSSGGYTLTPADPTLTAGTTEAFAFTVTGPDGVPVTAFDVAHDKRMHLIVVRRDATGFQHLHPEMTPDGTWNVPLHVPAGGSYRAFADFAPTGGEPVVLGVDLAVAGTFEPVPHAPQRLTRVDGYSVALFGDLVAGGSAPLTLTVSRDGVPITDLQPYLGAYGHLVALREGDLGYLHVHPDGEPGDGRTRAGPDITFHAEAPSAGTYRLFLDFSHDGVVRTAEFTLPTAPAIPGAPAVPHGADGHGH